MRYRRHAPGEVPAEMSWVDAGKFDLFLPGLEHLEAEPMGAFMMDRLEVTNRDFKRFVDAGGYADRKFWKVPILDGDRTLTFEEAIGRFKDRTGRTGPATWEVGSYAEKVTFNMNLVHGALRIPTTDAAALYSTVDVALRGPWGGEASVRATVVAALPDGIALGMEGYSEETLALLLTRAAEIAAEAPAEDESRAADEDRGETRQTAWDRIRALSQVQKVLLAVKAERTDRSLLAQDNDPRVLLSLLRNPRITVDEIARLAKSPFMSYQIAEAIMKSSQWMANPEVRIGLVNNPKTPQAFALRLLPTLPESEVRSIARGGTSMALNQAALRRLQGKS